MNNLPLDWAGAVEILEALASANDPIVVHKYCRSCGAESDEDQDTTTVADIAYCAEAELEDTSITFSGMKGKKITGTVLEMIVDRLGYELA